MSDNCCDPRGKVPAWVNAVIIICMLPLMAFPEMLSLSAEGSQASTFLWFYPFYVVASGICARICWPQRRELTWILLALMILSHIAMWALVLYD